MGNEPQKYPRLGIPPPSPPPPSTLSHRGGHSVSGSHQMGSLVGRATNICTKPPNWGDLWVGQSALPLFGAELKKDGRGTLLNLPLWFILRFKLAPRDYQHWFSINPTFVTQSVTMLPNGYHPSPLKSHHFEVWWHHRLSKCKSQVRSAVVRGDVQEESWTLISTNCCHPSLHTKLIFIALSFLSN